jgi:uncharacterized protein YutE (UPF0331/DUF86 family)
VTLNLPSVRTKLNYIVRCLGELQTLEKFTVDEILGDIYKYRSTERLLELIIQASLDINKHLLKEIYQKAPVDNADVFTESIRHEIIPDHLGYILTQAAKFRNLLAHNYVKVDPEQVVSYIEIALTDYPTYVQCINQYLDTLETKHD